MPGEVVHITIDRSKPATTYCGISYERKSAYCGINETYFSERDSFRYTDVTCAACILINLAKKAAASD